MKTINIIDFSEYPGLRHCNISDDSGEKFYHKILNNSFKDCFENGSKLVVNLDNTDAYASSFLDEAFGNLVFDFSLENVKKILEIKSVEEPHWIEMIKEKTFLQWEDRRIKGKAPIVTEKHLPWYRLINGDLIKKEWEIPLI